MDAATAQSPPPSASDAPAMATTTTTTKDPTPLASAAASLHSNSHSSIPLTPRSATSSRPGFIPLVTVVGFHHARGPEVESWFGAPEGTDPAADYDWSLLPFMALSDGAHASSEDFSYFTLLRPASEDVPATSLFGISCTRQLDSTQLLNRPADVTRSTVQKAVVVIADSPQYFGMMRERLSVVTQAWFAQREFTDTEILRRFQESLAEEKERGLMQEEEDKDQYLGMSLRELVREFRWQTLVLLKCCLLQPKMLFFGSRCERLCMMQFSLISLIPGLIRNLQDCADPEMNDYEQRLVTPTTLKTSDRNSLLTYMGLPLQIFAKGSLFGPYTPLQQLDILADFGTKSYIVGSTNSLLLQQKDRYSDILINLDDNSVNITSTSLRQALTLSAADRRWIDYLTQEVNETWDEANPGRPKTMGYVGSEEFIRLQFEEYILSLISSFKYHKHLQANQGNPRALLPHIEYDPVLDFGTDFVDYWTRTENHRMWNSHTDSHLFDVVDPKHPCAGGLTIDDVQRRIAQQVQDMHLDERFAQGREVLGRNFAAGRDKASTMFNKFYADLETYREAQRQKAKETQSAATSPTLGGPEKSDAQQGQQAASTKAGAYVGSWVSWAGEKRKGWGAGWGKKSDKSGASSPGPLSPREANPGEKEGRFSGGSFWARTSSSKDDHGKANGSHEEKRPMTGASFSESIISAAGTTDEASGSPRRGRRPLSGESVELQVRDVTPAQELPVLKSPVDTPRDAHFGVEARFASGLASPVKSEAPLSPVKVEAPVSPVKVEAASPAQVDGPVSPVKVEAPVSLVKVEERPASPIEVKDTPATPAKVETPTSPVKPTSAPVEEESEEDSKATAVKADDSTTEETVKQTEVTVQDTALPAATALPMSPTEESKAT